MKTKIIGLKYMHIVTVVEEKKLISPREMYWNNFQLGNMIPRKMAPHVRP